MTLAAPRPMNAVRRLALLLVLAPMLALPSAGCSWTRLRGGPGARCRIRPSAPMADKLLAGLSGLVALGTGAYLLGIDPDAGAGRDFERALALTSLAATATTFLFIGSAHDGTVRLERCHRDVLSAPSPPPAAPPPPAPAP